MHSASETPAGMAFGRFRALPHRRELLEREPPIRLGGRAFDALMVLIEARGAVVGKEALIARVWPDGIVEENTLVERYGERALNSAQLASQETSMETHFEARADG